MKPIQSPIQFVVKVLPRSLKWPVRVADHSPPCTAEIINAWMYTSTAPYAFMKKCTVQYRNNLLLQYYRDLVHCQLSCVYCCSCLVCIAVVVLCVLLQLSCVYCYHLMSICCNMCALLFLLQMPDCCLEVSIRKVLRPATSTHVFLGFLVSISKC